MKHGVIYMVLTAAVILTGSLPFSNHDVGKLQPVETLAVAVEKGTVVLETDAGDRGAGSTWEAAMENLKATAPGSVFLGTVSFLLLDDSALELLPVILTRQEINPACSLCLGRRGMDLEAAGAYLRAHEPEKNLRLMRAEGGALPRLLEEDGRYLLVQPGN